MVFSCSENFNGFHQSFNMVLRPHVSFSLPGTHFPENFYGLLTSSFSKSLPKCRPVHFCGSSDGKESVCNAGNQCLITRSGRSPGEENGYALQTVFLPGEFHEQRSMASYSTWGCKESDMIEQLTHSITLQKTHPHPMLYPLNSLLVFSMAH